MSTAKERLVRRIAADFMHQQLASSEFIAAWKKSYLKALEEGNPVILRDFADRVGGKPVERVDLNVKERPLEALNNDDLVALARARLANRNAIEAEPPPEEKEIQ